MVTDVATVEPEVSPDAAILVTELFVPLQPANVAVDCNYTVTLEVSPEVEQPAFQHFVETVTDNHRLRCHL